MRPAVKSPANLRAYTAVLIRDAEGATKNPVQRKSIIWNPIQRRYVVLCLGPHCGRRRRLHHVGLDVDARIAWSGRQ